MDRRIFNWLPNDFISEMVVEESIDYDDIFDYDTDDYVEEYMNIVKLLVQEAVSISMQQLLKKKRLAKRANIMLSKKRGVALPLLMKQKRKKASRWRRTHKAQLAVTKAKYARSSHGKKAKRIIKRREEKMKSVGQVIKKKPK